VIGFPLGNVCHAPIAAEEKFAGDRLPDGQAADDRPGIRGRSIDLFRPLTTDANATLEVVFVSAVMTG
jgi:hypothetical protein